MLKIGLCGEGSFVEEHRRTWVTFRCNLDGHTSKNFLWYLAFKWWLWWWFFYFTRVIFVPSLTISDYLMTFHPAVFKSLSRFPTDHTNKLSTSKSHYYPTLTCPSHVLRLVVILYANKGLIYRQPLSSSLFSSSSTFSTLLPHSQLFNSFHPASTLYVHQLFATMCYQTCHTNAAFDFQRYYVYCENGLDLSKLLYEHLTLVVTAPLMLRSYKKITIVLATFSLSPSSVPTPSQSSSGNYLLHFLHSHPIFVSAGNFASVPLYFSCLHALQASQRIEFHRPLSTRCTWLLFSFLNLSSQLPAQLIQLWITFRHHFHR